MTDDGSTKALRDYIAEAEHVRDEKVRLEEHLLKLVGMPSGAWRVAEDALKAATRYGWDYIVELSPGVFVPARDVIRGLQLESFLPDGGHSVAA